MWARFFPNPEAVKDVVGDGRKGNTKKITECRSESHSFKKQIKEWLADNNANYRNEQIANDFLIKR